MVYEFEYKNIMTIFCILVFKTRLQEVDKTIEFAMMKAVGEEMCYIIESMRTNK